MKFLKRWTAYFYNPWLIRDDKGKVIDDIPRRRHIKQNQRTARGTHIKQKHRVGVGGTVKMSGGMK